MIFELDCCKDEFAHVNILLKTGLVMTTGGLNSKLVLIGKYMRSLQVKIDGL